jgi:2-C-methyl-D-erythritol 4-phosphate cytidylyltransferase/2-C-methyl-D-erythritol 2,4-cyclodiphosphate synthase
LQRNARPLHVRCRRAYDGQGKLRHVTLFRGRRLILRRRSISRQATVSTIAIVVAAGRGSRVGDTTDGPKQYADLGGVAMLTRTLEVLASHGEIDRLLVVIHPDDTARYRAATRSIGSKLMPPVHGGATRQQSVRLGLEALARLTPPHAPERVLIHDAARPFLAPALIDRVLAALVSSPAALPGLAVADTLKRVDGSGTVAGTIDRMGLWRAQTPQGFRYDAILAAHRAAGAAGLNEFTDDSTLAEWHGMPCVLVEGDARNTKITTAEDLALAQQLTGTSGSAITDVRHGTGFDVHRFRAGDEVWLCGVSVPHTQALDGHSDADVGLHALTDALLGAIADGDIGKHFPPSDAQWKGARSEVFLADAARRVAAAGYEIGNVDVTLICEAPRVGPHRDAMRAEIARILGIEVARVGVKATTTETLGFTGRREGIAAMASATVQRRG